MRDNRRPPAMDINMGILALGSGSVLGTALVPALGLVPVAMWAVSVFQHKKKDKREFVIPEEG